MHKILVFSRKKECLPYLKFSDPLPKTHLFFIWPYHTLVAGATINTILSSARGFQSSYEKDWYSTGTFLQAEIIKKKGA